MASGPRGLDRGAGQRVHVSGGLQAFAALAAREGHPDQAVRLATAATALDEALPPEAGRRPPRDARRQPPSEAAGGSAQLRGQVRRCLDAAAGLGQAQVARLWAGGLELTADAAVALALEPPR